MEKENFVLVRQQRKYTAKSKWPKVHVSADTYQTLAEWAAETGRPLSDLVGQAVDFAEKNLVYVDP